MMNHLEKKLNRLLIFFEENIYLTLFLAFALSLIVRFLLIFTIYYLVDFPIERYDPYIYVLKAIEIAGGDWSPIATHSFGLPIFMAPFFYFFQSPSIFVNLIYGNFIIVLLSSLLIAPFFLVARELLSSRRELTLALFSFIISFWLILPFYGAIIL